MQLRAGRVREARLRGTEAGQAWRQVNNLPIRNVPHANH